MNRLGGDAVRGVGIDISTGGSKSVEGSSRQRFNLVVARKQNLSVMSATVWLPASGQSYLQSRRLLRVTK